MSKHPPPRNLFTESPKQKAKRIRAIHTSNETRKIMADTIDEVLPYLHSLQNLHKHMQKEQDREQDQGRDQTVKIKKRH